AGSWPLARERWSTPTTPTSGPPWACPRSSPPRGRPPCAWRPHASWSPPSSTRTSGCADTCCVCGPTAVAGCSGSGAGGCLGAGDGGAAQVASVQLLSLAQGGRPGRGGPDGGEVRVEQGHHRGVDGVGVNAARLVGEMSGAGGVAEDLGGELEPLAFHSGGDHTVVGRVADHSDGVDVVLTQPGGDVGIGVDRAESLDAALPRIGAAGRDLGV